VVRDRAEGTRKREGDAKSAQGGMNADFFERLYRGYAAEHFVSSQLFARRFEVFRLPADFGLDLVVTNQFRQAQGIKEHSECFPFGLQVKSRWLKENEVEDDPDGRAVAEFYFQLKQSEVELLIKQRNAGLACVFYWPLREGILHQPIHFWLHAKNVTELIDTEFLRQVDEGYLLTVRYSRFPKQSRTGYLDELSSDFKLEEKLKERLEKSLPESFARNWNASDYVAFARKTRDGNDSLVFRMPIGLSMDFDGFPTYQPLSGLN
jgi:hypothetical protein